MMMIIDDIINFFFSFIFGFFFCFLNSDHRTKQNKTKQKQNKTTRKSTDRKKTRIGRNKKEAAKEGSALSRGGYHRTINQSENKTALLGSHSLVELLN